MTAQPPNHPPFAAPSIRVVCPNCGRFLGRIAGLTEFPPCHNCGWQTTIAPPCRTPITHATSSVTPAPSLPSFLRRQEPTHSNNCPKFIPPSSQRAGTRRGRAA